jgi:hypothetical protein
MFACFKEKKYLCRQVNAGVHRTYSMSCTSVNRPNKRVEVENFSTSYFIYGKGEGKGGSLGGKGSYL